MAELDFLSAIQLIAIRNVFEGSGEDYVIRKVCRYVSNKFNMSLARCRKHAYG